MAAAAGPDSGWQTGHSQIEQSPEESIVPRSVRHTYLSLV